MLLISLLFSVGVTARKTEHNKKAQKRLRSRGEVAVADLLSTEAEGQRTRCGEGLRARLRDRR